MMRNVINDVRRYGVVILVVLTAAINLLYALDALQLFFSSSLTGTEQKLAISAISANLGVGLMLCWTALSLNQRKGVLLLMIIPLLVGNFLQSYTGLNAGYAPGSLLLNVLTGVGYSGLLALGYRNAGKNA